MKRTVSIWALFMIVAGLSAWQIGPGPPAPVLRSARITLSAAQINAMFTTPVLFIPAQGPGTVISLQKCNWNIIFGSAPFTGGGTTSAFYSPTSPPVSPASQNIVAAVFTGLSSNQILGLVGTVPSTGAAVNAGVYISNQTGVFAGGTGSSLVLNCTFNVVPGMQ